MVRFFSDMYLIWFFKVKFNYLIYKYSDNFLYIVNNKFFYVFVMVFSLLSIILLL